MCKRHYYVLLCFALGLTLNAQSYNDFIGNGHQIGISVSSSNESNASLANYTVAGDRRYTDEKGASRFLAQASMGGNYEDIQQIANMGIDDWLDLQFSMTPTSFKSEYSRIYDEVQVITPLNTADRNEYLSFAFYESLIKHPDVLRQKVAFA